MTWARSLPDFAQSFDTPPPADIKTLFWRYGKKTRARSHPVIA